MKFRKKSILTAHRYVEGMEDCWVVVDLNGHIQYTSTQMGDAETWLHDNQPISAQVKPAVYSREGAIPINEDSWIAEDGQFHYPIEDSYMRENYELYASDE